MEGWETLARVREEEEISWYRGLMEGSMDPTSKEILREILESEEQHALELGGKWMSA
jgi:rubrerythrin